jgi:hypothetical protein
MSDLDSVASDGAAHVRHEPTLELDDLLWEREGKLAPRSVLVQPRWLECGELDLGAVRTHAREREASMVDRPERCTARVAVFGERG